ncbi:MAG: hypothetical protein WCJ81_02560 [bacterium]
MIDMSKQSVSAGASQYGRNDLVTVISPSGEEKEMKYKKVEELLKQGWKVKG